jgi:hypothetical protein
MTFLLRGLWRRRADLAVKSILVVRRHPDEDHALFDENRTPICRVTYLFADGQLGAPAPLPPIARVRLRLQRRRLGGDHHRLQRCHVIRKRISAASHAAVEGSLGAK